MGQANAASDGTPPPQIKAIPLLVLIPGMALTALAFWLAAREIWELTFLAWRNGPYGPGCDLSCSGNIGIAVLDWLLLVFWFCPCLVALVIWKIRRHSVKPLSWIAVGTAAVCVGLMFCDSGTLNRLFIGRVATSPHAGWFLANAGGDDDPRLLQALLERGVPVDSRNFAGDTALSMAVTAEKPMMVAFLIEKGANVDATDLYGDSPLEMAQTQIIQNKMQESEYEQKEDEANAKVIALLLQHGAHAIKGSEEQRKHAEEQIKRNWTAAAEAP